MNVNDNEAPLYDDFGNYIGPDLDDDSSEESSSSEEEEEDNDDNASHATSVSDLDETMQVSEYNNNNNISLEITGTPSNQIVLHEDKVHYQSAEALYGPDVTTAVIDEDAMHIDTPILKPTDTASPTDTTTPSILKQNSKYSSLQKVSESYFTSVLIHNPTTITRRSVAVIGHLNTGKTTLLDRFVLQTFLPQSQQSQSISKQSHSSSTSTSNTPLIPPRYTDTLPSEQTRQMSLQSTPITLPLPNSKGKYHAITFIDCPGHTQFHDESITSLTLADGAMLLIDAVEGLMLHTELLIQSCVSMGLPIFLVINKVDRLIVELKLSPEDAYCKIRNVIEEVNLFLESVDVRKRYGGFCPSRGNVGFSSGVHGWCFTLQSLAAMYVDHVENNDHDSDSDDDDDEEGDESMGYGISSRRFKHGALGLNLTIDEFAKRLWGNTYLDPSTKTFCKKASMCNPSNTPRTFIQFVLEPIYKIYSTCLGESEKDVSKVLRSIGVFLSKEQMRSCSSTLIKAAFEIFLGDTSGFVDAIVMNIPSPSSAALGKISRCYTGNITSPIAKSMISCDSDGPLIIHVTKLYAHNSISSSSSSNSNGENNQSDFSFSAFGRIYSGSVKPGDKVKVLGEGYTPEDDEDMAFATVTAVSIPRGRFRTEVSVATAGNWVLLDGIDANISKTATIVGVSKDQSMSMYGNDDEVRIFRPLKYQQAGGESVVKLSVEPLNPSELPKMVEGLRRISKSYPMVRTRVEESGEHVLYGTGELYLDCVMHDLRHVFSDIEVNVADPVVGFRETVVDTSSIKCFAETANKRNKLTMIAEPLDEGLAEQLEAGKVNLDWDNKKVGRYFQSKYDWDLLSARSVWAFGDSPTHGPNILMDDTLPSEVDKGLLSSCKSSIVQGFQWAMREGPLCEEFVRSTKVKILDTVLSDKAIYRGAGQIIPTARKVVHSSLLTASPRLMEPVYRLQIQCPGDIVDAISPILTKRRGHVVQDKPIPGSPLFLMKAFLPVMDSFGFETDLRTYTQGQAMVHSVFDHWAIVPGDPLDRSIILHPLEPSPPQHLARDFLVKTRRRKGLSEDVSVIKFFDEEMRSQLE